MDAELSYVKGADAPPLLETTIGAALDAAAARWGEADALVSVHQRIRWSWRILAARADALAVGFLASTPRAPIQWTGTVALASVLLVHGVCLAAAWLPYWRIRRIDVSSVLRS